MKKKYEKYPKDILYYLEDFEKKGINYWKERSFFEEDIEPSISNRYRKDKHEKEIEKLGKDMIYIYFDKSFKEKAKQYIIEDSQKEFLIYCIDTLCSGQKSYYSNEHFKSYNGFVYSLFVSTCSSAKNESQKLRFIFGIFFEKTPRIKPYSTYVEKIIFFDFSNEINLKVPKNYEKIIYNFEQKFASKNNDLEFDKMMLFGDIKERLFYKRKEEDTSKYYYSFHFELPAKNEIYKKEVIFGTEYTIGFNMKIWDLKYPVDTVLNNLNGTYKFNYNGFFEKDILNFHPSKLETRLINMNENFILSGRPGTGKTVIILIKVIMFYLKCLYAHSELIHGEIDFDYINNNLIINSNKNEETDENDEIIKSKENMIIKIPKNIIYDNELKKDDEDSASENSENNNNNLENGQLGSEGNTYKIIFTSLSQSLCAHVENFFSQAIKNSNIPINIIPTSQKTYQRMSSFVSQRKYPLFLNFRKLLFMIDGSLNYQFLDRPNNNQLKKRQEDCDIRYYPDCEYDVMADLSLLTKRPGNIYFYRRKYLSDPLVMTEINEDTFYNNFNSQIKSNKILNNEGNYISTYEVYANIISIIKGSIKSYLCGYLSKEEYYSLGKKICPFNLEQRKEIYKIFENYESWKAKNKYFDIQDTVNYLIREVNIELVPQNRKLLDLVFIDEVQDFSINQLYLLYLISRDIKVLAGDTCQTISKINTFRFADLNNVLYTIGEIENIKIKEPKHVEINLNFRCQANILRFAHLIYEMIHYFFSNTLDKVRMDFSTQVGGGEKPFLIPYKINFEKNKNNIQIVDNKTGFDYFLKGLTDNNLFLDDEKAIINISFSVNHCVICRNNDVVKKLNEKYKNKIFCSTVYESKGLEYEIVILYNFFKDSLPFVNDIWKFILKNIRFNKVENNYLSLVKQNLDYENIPQSTKDEIYTIFKDKFNVEFPQNISEQFSLFNFCAELKEFYVAVTRAKSRLFIYEEDMNILKLFVERINNLDILVQEVFIKNNKEKDKENKNSYNLVENYGDNSNLLNKRIKGLLKFISQSKTTKENLYNTAFEEYNQNNEYNYKKALYLFQVINDDLMKNKSLINLKFIEMERIKDSKNDKKKEFIQMNEEILNLINKINYDDDKQIKGEVLFNLEKYEEALNYFKSKNNYKKCGIVLIKTKNYENALEYFDKGKEYSFAVHCLIELEQYEKLYSFLLLNKDQFDLEHIQYYYKITCDKFFKKYMIPISNIEKTINKLNKLNNELNGKNKVKKIEKDENINKKDIHIKYNIISNNESNENEKIEYIDKNNNLFNLISNEKIKIKNPFIIFSKSNYSIFDINNSDKKLIYDMRKPREQIIHLINSFIDLVNFMQVYLQIIITKTEKTEKQESLILKCKKIISLIEGKMKNNSEMEIEQLINIMKSLVVKEHDYKVIINGVLKNINAKDYVYSLYDILIFKANILEHMIEDLPILVRHRYINNKININILYKESIRQIVEYSKYLPFDEDFLVKNMKSVLILSGNYNAIFGIISTDDIKSLIDLSIILKKVKLFELVMLKLGINFVERKIENNAYKNINITAKDKLYFMNNYINMLLYKFFKYYLADKKDENKIDIILQKIKIFPKIYRILVQLVNNNNNNNKLNFNSLIDDINEYYDCYETMLSSDDSELNKNLLKYIIIGTEISLFIYLYNHPVISIDLGITNDIKFNNDLLNKYIIIITKIMNIINKINKYYESNSINNIGILSLFNAFGAYSINNYLPIFKENYKFIKESKIIHNFNSDNFLFNKDVYLIKNNLQSKFCFDQKNNIKYFNSYGGSFPIMPYLNSLVYEFCRKINSDDKINYIEIIYRFLFDLMANNSKKQFEKYWKDKNNFNKIIIYLSNMPYEGEYLIDNHKYDLYLQQAKIVNNNNKELFENILNILYKEKLNNNSLNLMKKENDSFIKLVNYILYSNLIGGMIKNDYTKYNMMAKDDENNYINPYYLNKEYSYIHSLKLLNDYYCSELNQLLVILWLRKIYNCIYCFFYDNEKDKENKFKLYIDKNSSNIKLNLNDINKILFENNCKNNSFVENYFKIFLSFIFENEKMKENNNLSDIKINVSQIYHSLKSLNDNLDLIGNNKNIKRQIKLILDELKSKYLLSDKDKSSLKEVIIINEKNLQNNIIIQQITKSEQIQIDEELEENSDNYDSENEYYEDIEQNLLKDKLKDEKYY